MPVQDVVGSPADKSADGDQGGSILGADDDQPITGFTADECVPTVIDTIDETVQWKGQTDLSPLLGKTVRLRFSLHGAELYAFWFA